MHPHTVRPGQHLQLGQVGHQVVVALGRKVGDIVLFLQPGDILRRQFLVPLGVRSEQCRVMNPSITTAEWAQYRNGIQRNIQARQRLMARSRKRNCTPPGRSTFRGEER